MLGESQSELVVPIRNGVHAALQSRAVLDGIKVLQRAPKQLQSDIEAAIAELGLALFVFPALLLEPAGNIPGPYFNRIEVRVRIIENSLLNATPLDAYQLVEIVHWILNGLQIAGVPGLNPLSPAPQSTVAVDDPEKVIFDIVYQTSAGLTPRPDSP